MRHSMHKALNIKTSTGRKPICGGINNGFSILDIKKNEDSSQLNIQSVSYPSMRPRFPRTSIGPTVASPSLLDSRSGAELLTTSGLVLKKYNFVTNVWNTIGSISSTNNAVVTEFGNTMLFANGVDAKSLIGSTFATVPGMPMVNLLETFAGRCYGANTANDKLSFSATASPLDWTLATFGGEITVATKSNSKCRGLKLFNNHIVYFKEDSIHELYGTHPGNYYMQLLTDKMGCISPKSIVEVAGALYFASIEGYYVYGGGMVPQNISYPFIDGYIKRIDLNNLDKCVSGATGEIMYTVLPIDDGDTVLLTYNTRLKQWYVEDDPSYVAFYVFNFILYAMTRSGQLVQIIDKNGSEVVNWNFVTKALTRDIASAKKQLDKLYVTMKVETGSTVTVALSQTTNGNDFVTVGTFSSTADYEVKEIIIPHVLHGSADWHRIKISGTGDSTIDGLEYQLRIIPTSH